VLCTVKVYRSEIAGQEVKKEDKKKKLKEKKKNRRLLLKIFRHLNSNELVVLLTTYLALLF
jgi:hypothetical protein